MRSRRHRPSHFVDSKMAHSAAFYISVFASVVEALGLLLTAWRIYFRLKISRFWWEDAWAAVLLAIGLLWIIAFWIYLIANGLTAIVTSWIYSIGFNCIVTLARMSILFSIIRIICGNSRLLRFTYGCVFFFVACWVILVIEKVWQCASNPSWHYATATSPYPFCLVGKQISIFKFTTDCISVSILVVLPLRILWRVKLPIRRRRMILSIFASSVVLALAALFHMIGQIMNIVVVMNAGLHVEVALSIIVCNLLVAVTYTYQFLLHDKAAEATLAPGEPNDDDDFTTRLRQSTQATTYCLTTVDLEASLISQRPSATLGSI